MRKVRSYIVFKRIIDMILSFVLIVFLLPLMGIIYLLVVFTSSGGGIFRQLRLGKDGEPFYCYKFRTMYEDAPREIPASKNIYKEEYITPIGRVLRRTSLDELPQLFNVLLGDMSLVGPRPLILNEGEIHSFRKRCGVYSIRPGMTGLAQINGRTEISDIEKTRLDVRYLRNMSLFEDTRILFNTARGAFARNYK